LPLQLPRKMTQNRWTREELILSFNLYLKLPFGKLHSGTPQIIHLASLLGRTTGSVAMRLNNFASVDPYHQNRGIKGLDGGKKQVQPIWDEFIEHKEDLIFESEQILAIREQKPLEVKFPELHELENLTGDTKIREVKTRVNQNVFRQMVLANYQNRCAVTGINLPELLVASHILPWSSHEKERLNPENGICLSPLYDKAFDKGLIGFNERFEMQISSRLEEKRREPFYSQWFEPWKGKSLVGPQKYLPRKEFLEWHGEEVFRK